MLPRGGGEAGGTGIGGDIHSSELRLRSPCGNSLEDCTCGTNGRCLELSRGVAMQDCLCRQLADGLIVTLRFTDCTKEMLST